KFAPKVLPSSGAQEAGAKPAALAPGAGGSLSVSDSSGSVSADGTVVAKDGKSIGATLAKAAVLPAADGSVSTGGSDVTLAKQVSTDGVAADGTINYAVVAYDGKK